MDEVLFFIAAIAAIGGAVGVVVLRNPFFAVLSLVFHLLALAALFLLLYASFVAAAQVIVYAGAVMVLYVFVVAYVGGDDEPTGRAPGATLRFAAVVFAGALFVELAIATLGSGLTALGGQGAEISAGFGSPEQIGELLLTKFLLVFEVASILLLVAAVAAVMLARRRRGLAELPEEERAGQIAARPGMETLSEAEGSLGDSASVGQPQGGGVRTRPKPITKGW